MNRRPSPPNETQSLADRDWKAREFDKKNLQVQDFIVSELAAIRIELATLKARLGIIALLSSTVVTALLHLITQYFRK